MFKPFCRIFEQDGFVTSDSIRVDKSDRECFPLQIDMDLKISHWSDGVSI
jgi:hypothetical protein